MRLYTLRFAIENPLITVLGAWRPPALDLPKIQNVANLKRREFLEEVLPSLIAADLRGS